MIIHWDFALGIAVASFCERSETKDKTKSPAPRPNSLWVEGKRPEKK